MVGSFRGSYEWSCIESFLFYFVELLGRGLEILMLDSYSNMWSFWKVSILIEDQFRKQWMEILNVIDIHRETISFTDKGNKVILWRDNSI